MKKNLFIPKLCSVSLVFILAQGVSHAMPGMHGSGSGASKGVEQSRRENQFIRIGDGDYLQCGRQDRDICVDP